MEVEQTRKNSNAIQATRRLAGISPTFSTPAVPDREGALNGHRGQKVCTARAMS
jgi:hypothetical protein